MKAGRKSCPGPWRAQHLPGSSPDELLTAPGFAAAAPWKLRGRTGGRKRLENQRKEPKGARAWISRAGNAPGAEGTAGSVPWTAVPMSLSLMELQTANPALGAGALLPLPIPSRL